MKFTSLALTPVIFLFCLTAAVSAAPTSALETSPDGKKTSPKHMAQSTMSTTVKAPIEYLWEVLVDFDKYPQIFSRLDSVSVTKRNGNLVYVESHLKPHFYVKKEVQHTINDLAGKPDVLKWQLLDGNFKEVQGEWCLKQLSQDSTRVTYKLSVDPGPVIPAPMISFILHFVQKEIVSSFAQYSEKNFVARQKAQTL